MTQEQIDVAAMKLIEMMKKSGFEMSYSKAVSSIKFTATTLTSKAIIYALTQNKP